MANQQEDEKIKPTKPEIGSERSAETPAQAAAAKARAEKEKQAAAELVGAEEGEVVENREKKKLKDITYFHVDDIGSARKATEQALERIGLDKNKNKFGDCGSVQELNRWLKVLAKSKDPLDIILLDRTFPEYEDEEADSDSWRKALESLDGYWLKQEDDYKEALGDTKVIIMSGDSIDAKELEEIKKRFPRVIGFLNKGVEAKTMADDFKKILEDAEVVEKDG